MQELGRKGCAPETLRSYRWNLQAFYKTLPEGRLQPGATQRWRDDLLQQGYQPNTVKHRLSSVNGMLSHLGLWAVPGGEPAHRGPGPAALSLQRRVPAAAAGGPIDAKAKSLFALQGDRQHGACGKLHGRRDRGGREGPRNPAGDGKRATAPPARDFGGGTAAVRRRPGHLLWLPVCYQNRPAPEPGQHHPGGAKVGGRSRPSPRKVQPPGACSGSITPRCRGSRTTWRGWPGQAYESLLEQEQLAIGWEGGFLR